MTDDFLTTFRSEMPMPDDETKQRIYERATDGRGPGATRRRIMLAAAVLALAGVAIVLGVTLSGGGASLRTGPVHGPHPGGPGGGMALAPVTMDTHVSGGELTSIDLTLRSTRPDTTLDVKVVRKDGTVVLQEQVTPTVYNSSMQDATHASWSGTLTPSNWDGGCQAGLYRIEYAFGPDADTGTTDWFACTGLAGSSGPTGSSGP